MQDQIVARNLVLILLLVSSVIVLTITSLLYRTGVERASIDLVEMVDAQIRLVSAVAEFDAMHSGAAFDEGRAREATLSQLFKSHQHSHIIDSTRDLYIGQLTNKGIKFLLEHPHISPKKLTYLDPSDPNALPMHLALQGKTGVLETSGFFGQPVIAAYAYVDSLKIGIVAEINYAEIRSPYITAGSIALLVSIIVAIAGSIGLLKAIKPTLIRLNTQTVTLTHMTDRLNMAQELAHVGNWDWNIETGELWWSDEIFRVFGSEPGAFEATYEKFLGFIHKDDVLKVQNAVQSALDHPHKTYHVEHRIVRKDGVERNVLEQGHVTRNAEGIPIYMVGTVLDITDIRLIEEELKNSEARLRSFLNSTGEAIYGIDTNGTCLFANQACLDNLGYASPADLYGKNMHQLIHHSHENGDPYPEEQSHVLQFKRGKSAHEDSEVFWRKNGEYFPVEYQAAPIYTDGEITGAVVSFSDISERIAVQKNMRLSDQVFKHTGEAIMITEASGEIINVNPAFTAITGYRPDEVLGKLPSMMKSGRHDKTFYKNMWQDIESNGCWSGEVWDRHKTGIIYPKSLTINAVKDTHAKVIQYIGIFSDITPEKDAEKKLQHMAFYDSLTQLPNRTLYKERLEQELRIAKRRNEHLAVLFLDLDRFKYINDTLGHATGDELLVEASQRISECVRESDTVARLGGDEFTVILSNTHDTQSIEKISRAIINSISKKFIIKDNDVNIGVSIGIALYPKNGDNYGDLIKNADAAMYKAKEAGRNTFSFFTDDLQATMIQRLTAEKALKEAIEKEEFTVFYQPKISLEEGDLVGAEALLRWPSTNGKMIPPFEFIPLAEETGLIIPLGEWVLNKACQQAAQWLDMGHSKYRMSVNLSGRQLEIDNLIEVVKLALERANLAPKHLELEVTESMLMKDADMAIEKLGQLRDLGIRISIDDFGTGYSSLSYLKRLPIHTLKIDRSFVMDLDDDADDRAIVSAIISMANTLGLHVTAEGVETQGQCEYLRNAGVDEIQGFLFGKPMTADDFQEYFLLNFFKNPNKLPDSKLD